MDMGGVGAAFGALLVYVAALLLGSALVVAIGLSFSARRLIVWTPVVLVLTVPFLDSAPWVVLIIAGWFLLAWPWGPRKIHDRRPGPLRALVYSLVGCVGVSLTLTILWGLNAGAQQSRAQRQKVVVRQPPTVTPMGAPQPLVDGMVLDQQRRAETQARSPARPPTNGQQAMTWVVRAQREEGGETYVLVGTDDSSNAYRGDMPITSALPILAFRPIDAPAPAFIGRHWSAGEVALSPPVAGADFHSLDDADAWLRQHLGDGWRMASFHDGGGWKFWARGSLDVDPERRFWVYIRDQPANPWAR